MYAGFEKIYLCEWDRPKKHEYYNIVGYDKDADVYVRLINVHMPLNFAVSIADHVASLSPKRESNGEPFDWLEVITELEGIRHHVAPCV